MRHYAPAPLDRALPFLTQLAGAIDFARAAGVGHGALHLRDVFVTPDEARASGFGIVEALERVGVRAPVRRPYSAPERIAGDEWSTPADVFSLAAIAYELLTGRRPSGTGEQIGDLTGENLGGHAAAIRSVLARAMDDDPGRRYRDRAGICIGARVGARTAAADAASSPPPVVRPRCQAPLAPPARSAASRGPSAAAAQPLDPPIRAAPVPVDPLRRRRETERSTTSSYRRGRRRRGAPCACTHLIDEATARNRRRSRRSTMTRKRRRDHRRWKLRASRSCDRRTKLPRRERRTAPYPPRSWRVHAHRSMMCPRASRRAAACRDPADRR